MVSFPAEILLGLYFGVLVGVVSALISWGAGFGLTRWRGTALPIPAALLFALGLGGGLAGVIVSVETPGLSIPGPAGLAVSGLVIAVLGLSAHEYGTQRALSVEHDKSVEDGTDKDHDAADVDEKDGQPQGKLKSTDTTTVQLAEDVAGRSPHAFPHISAALAADDRHAVSVNGLIPAGVSTGDAVTVITPTVQVRGTVLAARTEDDDHQEGTAPTTTAGGQGRLTVAVTRTDVEPLVRAPAVKIVVESRETPIIHHAIAQIQRDENELRQLILPSTSSLAGQPVGTVAADTELTILGRRAGGDWEFPPSGEQQLAPGDELFIAGPRAEVTSLGGQQ